MLKPLPVNGAFRNQLPMIVIVCLSAIFALLGRELLPFRDAIKIKFESQAIEAMTIKLDTFGSTKTVDLSSTDLRNNSHLLLYQSKIRSLEIVPKKTTKKTALIFSGFDKGQRIEFSRIIKNEHPSVVLSDLDQFGMGNSGWYFVGLWCGFIFLLSLLFAVHWTIQQAAFTRSDWLQIALLAAILAAFGWMEWPGLFLRDGFSNFKMSQSAGSHPFLGLLYSSTLFFSYFLFSNIGGPLVFNLILLFCILVSTFDVVRRRPAALVCFWISLLFFFLSFFNRSMLALHNRDSTFGLLFTLFLIRFYHELKNPKESWSWSFLFFILCSLMRMETLLVAPLVYAAEYWVRKAGRRDFFAKLLIYSGVILFYFNGTSSLRKLHQSNEYKLSAILPPLYYILKTEGLTAISSKDLEMLDLYWSRETAMSYPKLEGINILRDQVIKKGSVSSQMVDTFRHITINAILQNPWAWLKSRWELGLIIDRRRSLALTEKVSEDSPKQQSLQLHSQFYPGIENFNNGESFGATYLDRNPISSRILNTGLLGLALSLFGMFLWKFDRPLALISGIMFFRNLIVFALAPAAMAKYYWPLSLVILFLPAFFLMTRVKGSYREHIKKSRQNKANF